MNGKLKVLDLFSGIGGFSLGLEATGGFETVAFCEIEPYPRAVLKKHWPEVPCFEDVRTLDATGLGTIDVITGGFPCQPFSSAASAKGARKGVADDRFLWPEIQRIIRDTRPRWVILENVTRILTNDAGRTFGRILSDLDEIGYDAEWHCLDAAYLGSPHSRDRVWVVAYPHSRIQLGCAIHEKASSTSENARRHWEMYPGNARVDDGIPNRMVRLKCLGNAVVPQIPEIIGRAILEAGVK